MFVQDVTFTDSSFYKHIDAAEVFVYIDVYRALS